MDPSKDSPLVREQQAGKTDARKWLAADTDRRGIGEMTAEDSIELVDRIYKMGALNLWVSDLKTGGAGYESANILLIALPAGGPQRQQIFKWFSRHTIESGFDPEEDRGQAHVAAWFP